MQFKQLSIGDTFHMDGQDFAPGHMIVVDIRFTNHCTIFDEWGWDNSVFNSLDLEDQTPFCIDDDSPVVRTKKGTIPHGCL